MSRFYLS